LGTEGHRVCFCLFMASSGMLRRVVLVRTDVSEELRSSIIRVTRIGGLGTTVAATSNRSNTNAASVVPSSPILVTLMKEALGSSELSVLTRATRRNIPGEISLHFRTLCPRRRKRNRLSQSTRFLSVQSSKANEMLLQHSESREEEIREEMLRFSKRRKRC
jgi:hypothetical protein